MLHLNHQRPVALNELLVLATRWMGSDNPMAKAMVIKYRDQIIAHPDAVGDPQANRVVNACTAYIVS